MIKAICFDLDGVYFTPRGKQGFFESVLNLGVPKEKIEYVLYKSPEMLEFVTGKMSEDKFWDFVRNYWQLDKTNQELINLWVKDYEIDQEVKEYIEQVRKAGYKSCVASNNNLSRVKALQEKFNFLDDFDVVVFSYEIGFVKPQKEFYQALINKAGCQPQELIYSDDNLARIQGAKELGINVFVYENFQQFKHKVFDLGVKT